MAHFYASAVFSDNGGAISNPQYELLVTAIVDRAVRDYKYATKKIWEPVIAWLDKPESSEIEVFFRSEWFTELTGLDGEWFLSALRKELGLE